MQTNASTVAVAPSLKVVINGGDTILESASVPFQIGVNGALAEIQPTHVLIITQQGDKNSSQEQTRELIPLTRGSGFITFMSPGRHRVTFVALKHDEGSGDLLRLMGEFLIELWPGCFRNSINNTGSGRPDFNDSETNSTIVAWTTIEVEIPDGFFAKPPAEWVWKWVNLWFKYQPVDQCSFRKRAIFAFTFKPFLWFLFNIVWKYVIYAPAASIWLVSARCTVFLLGWWPTPIFSELDCVWGWNCRVNSVDWDIAKFSARDHGVKNGRGRWGEWDGYYPIALPEIILLFIAGFLMWFGWATAHDRAETLGSRISVPAVCLVFAYLILSATKYIVLKYRSWGIRLSEKLKNKAEELKRAEEVKKTSSAKAESSSGQGQVGSVKPSYYFEFLRETLSDSKLPEHVDALHVPPAFKGKLVHRMRMSFNAAKAKVCRPFPRK